ncbi:MAG: late competence development ComFB family protein [Cyanobacteria bacterium SID2]|nr:late competence development ComFB family protein [Cyanobacteria bacterium SID2]MBP0006023.1 late competence development ComFB family protein [Cyanobacteria bacterium SBC]
MTLHLAKEYINVMEVLVAEEVENQLQDFSQTMLPYIRKADVATYALNRLPCLYASSKEGFERQKKLGIKKYSKQIEVAVRQALIAIQRDPIRRFTPLLSPEELEYQGALLQLVSSLPKHSNLRQEVARALRKAISIEKPPRAVSPRSSISPKVRRVSESCLY